MQTIQKILRLDGGVGSWCTEKGILSNTPALAIGLMAQFQLDLRTTAFDSESRLCSMAYSEFSDISSWYLAVDADFNQSTAPVIYTATPAISVAQNSESRTILSFQMPNTGITALLNAAAANEKVTLKMEIGGLNGSANLIFMAQFSLVLQNRIWVPGGSVPAAVSGNPEYLTAVEVEALIDAATRSTTPGPAGTTPSINSTNKHWMIGTTDTGIIAEGQNGTTPSIGQNGHWFIGSTDTGVTAAGANGLSAYQIAQNNGFTGTAAQWLASLKGADGTGLQIDATGELAELHSYDDEDAGFVFAASVVDSVAHTCTKYYYVKQSSTHGDWCDPPLTDVTYESAAELTTIAPVTFTAPSSNAEYLEVDVSDYANAWLTAVTINTAEGEQQLLPGMTTGISKVLKTSGGMLRIYFGVAVPSYSTGKIYFSQFLGVTGSTTPSTPTTNESMLYGYITSAVAGNITGVSELTSTIIEAAKTAGTLTETTASAAGKITLNNVPAYSWIVGLVPSSLKVQKDDGVGGKTAFATNNGAANSGANGTSFTLGTTTYKLYGELQIVTAQSSIYIEENA